MIITDDFVYVHLSKTGGTFVEENLKELLAPGTLNRKLHRLDRWHRIRVPFYRYRYRELAQHGVCRDIPADDFGKTIVASIRSPFDLYVSEYTFNWWKRFPDEWFDDVTAVKAQYPNLLDIDFSNFVRVSNVHARWVQRALKTFPQSGSMGWYSHKFVHYFCKQPDIVFEAAGDPDLLFQRVQETMYPIHFLFTDRLNDDLYTFLSSVGYDEQKISFIKSRTKINSSRNHPSYRKWFTEELRREVERKEALLFRLFSNFAF